MCGALFPTLSLLIRAENLETNIIRLTLKNIVLMIRRSCRSLQYHRKTLVKQKVDRQLLKQEQANALNGYLHMRFYRDELNGAGHYGNPQHTKKDKAEDGTETVTRPYVAYGYTTAYPRDAYMGLFISDLHFYARSWTQDGDETKTPRITAMTVVLTVAKRDANNQIVPLCTQKAIVQLPGEPVILYEPGTWDGKASSES